MQEILIWTISVFLVAGFIYVLIDNVKDNYKEDIKDRLPFFGQIILFFYILVIPTLLILVTALTFNVGFLNIASYVFLAFYLTMFTIFKKKKVFPKSIEDILFLLFAIVPI